MRRFTIALGIAMLVVFAGCASRQSTITTLPAAAPQPTAQSTEQSKEANPTEDVAEAVVVTGSYIQGTAEDAALPVDVINAEDFEKSGSPGTVEVLRNQSISAGAAAPTNSTPTLGNPQLTNTERYQHFAENPVRLTREQPVSTFSIDVDTGAYANVRRYLNRGRLPPQDAVRVEEMINYFDYDYAAPKDSKTPFSVATEVAPAPWNPDKWLLKIGIQGERPMHERPAANLVFLIDVSGSMATSDKLPLLKKALRLLVQQLTARDRVSMVVYAGASGTVLEPTAGDRHAEILEAIERLEAGGSTNGGEGIERAYQLAHAALLPSAANRVILATDGDFNVGVVDFHALLDIARRNRVGGVALTTLGFGTGNYNDELLEQLADAGDGNYAYVDTLSEARKVLVTELSATLVTIAKDVKIQIEFNPAEVLEYRLIGYQNRVLQREDFNNDAVDAGEIGAGHRVTALYEIVPKGSHGSVDPLRYADKPAPSAGAELAFLRLRYKNPDSANSRLLEVPIMKRSVRRPQDASRDFQFVASVAAFGELLRGGQYLGQFGYEQISALADASLGPDPQGYRHEFAALVKVAQSLSPVAPQTQRVGDQTR